MMIRHTWMILKSNKDFIFMITLQPVLIFLLMSFLLAYSTTHKIAVVNHDSGTAGRQILESLQQLEGLEIYEIEEENAVENLMSGTVELAVIVGENPRQPDGVEIFSMGKSEAEAAVTFAVNQILSDTTEKSQSEPPKIQFETNQIKEKGLTISYSLGFMIFKLVNGSSLLAALLINERVHKMRERIFLSGIGVHRYLGGKTFAYLLGIMAGSAIYYLTASLLKFDFGMRYSIGFLLMLFAANIFSAALYVFASTLVNDEGSLWFMQSFIIMPIGLLSGALFPFHLMPRAVQNIANCLPFRWIINGIECMQKNGDLISALPNIVMILAVSAILYGVAAYRTKRII